ncbi:MAG: ABC transporter permease [Clostridiales bacterium]|nr:ABC transporter permease [Clostridiales bacterium]
MNNRMPLLREQWFLLLIVVAVLSLIAGINNPNYVTVGNMVSILEQISVLGLVAAGATILIISGNFDISVGSMIGLTTCCVAMIMNAGFSDVVAVLLGIVISCACALFNGTFTILLRAPSFIVSLATMGVFRGIALALTSGTLQTIYGRFEFIGKTRFFDFIPLLFIISLAGYFSVHYILTKTKLGRRVYAIGNNSNAAYLSGIKVNQNKLVFFLLNGILVGVAAALLLSRVGTAQPATGSGYEMKAIGAVVIGGVPLFGGRGKVLGTFCGVLLLGVISNVLNMLQVSPYTQDIVFGLLVLAALAVSRFSAGKSGS